MFKKIMITNMNVCTGCNACCMACSSVKKRLFSFGGSRIRVYKKESECLSVPIVCEHCPNPPCLKACPSRAITKDTRFGIVRIDPNLCNGCGVCLKVCPFGAPILENGTAIICDLCDGNPKCARFCLPRAISYVNLEDSSNLLKWRYAKERIAIFRKLVAEVV